MHCRIPLYLEFKPDKTFSKHDYIKSISRYTAFKTALMSHTETNVRISEQQQRKPNQGIWQACPSKMPDTDTWSSGSDSTVVPGKNA